MGVKQQLTVRLNGGGPWGFRLQGGAGTGLPLVVAKVRRKSKAYKRLHEGDLIASINGNSCERLTYDHVMEIADKCGTDLILQVERHESKKEKKDPMCVDSTPKSEGTAAIKEMISLKDTTTKVTEETEGLLIKSVTVLDETSNAIESRLDSFTSEKLKDPGIKENMPTAEPFPPFSELLQTQSLQKLPGLSNSSTKSEEVSGDNQNYEKTTKETVHEVTGNTATTIVKEERESVARSNHLPHQDGGSVPGITLDTIDLNNLISATQKKLDSFKDSFKADTSISSYKESLLKTETSVNSFQDGFKSASPSNSFLDSFKTESITNKDKADTNTNIVNDSFKGDVSSAINFKDSFVSNSASTKTYEVKKIETTSTTSESVFSSKNALESVLGELKDITFTSPMADLKNTESIKKIPPPTLPKPKIRPFSDSFLENFKDLHMDLNETFGLVGSDSESSYVSTQTPFGTTITKKKKMFSSSSFYEEPQAIYPTVEEQVEMAKKIADSLADDTNKKSKGANMFFKRVKKSTKWIHEGPEPSDESGPGTPEILGEPPTPDPSVVPWKSQHKVLPSLHLVLDPRHTENVSSLKSSGHLVSEHNVVSPQVCHILVKDLQSPVGKGAALFAKRKKKSEEWVVDGERVKRATEMKSVSFPTVPPLYQSPNLQQVKLVKSPWEAAMESPFGTCDSAFGRVNPDKLADTVIKAADYKRTTSFVDSWEPPCRSPPPVSFSSVYSDIYHAKAPKGWVPPSHVYTPPQSFATPMPASQTVYQDPCTLQNGFAPAKKMVFQNFNAVPRLWRGSTNT